MKITNIILPPNCDQGACPSLVLTDDGVILIQGAKLPSADRGLLKVPDHEDVVSIPKEVFDALVAQYGR